MNHPPKYSRNVALQRLRRYCAYQERCHQEVRNKLKEWHLYYSEAEQILTQLIEEGFLNEERYAKAFAGGKFRAKGWGRQKIMNALRQKGISSYLITSSLKEIDTPDYSKKLEQLLQKKKISLKEDKPMIQKQKLVRFALSKGYESEMVWAVVNELMGNPYLS